MFGIDDLEMIIRIPHCLHGSMLQWELTEFTGSLVTEIVLVSGKFV